MRRVRLLLFFAAVILFSVMFGNARSAEAFQVAPLPEGNLLQNPWFRSQSDPTRSALDGWTDAAGPNMHWSSSQKVSNPTADQIVSGICHAQELYCGTGARLSLTPGQSGGVAQRGVDAYLYQVVEADGSKRKLRFFAHWVSHLVNPAEVTIYGSDSPDGPWTPVWVPFHVVQEQLLRPSEGNDTRELWEETGMQETIIEQGFSHYKVEIHARFPNEGTVGFKITGIYFAVEDVAPGEAVATTGPATVLPAPTVAPAAADSDATPESTATRERAPTPVPSATAAVPTGGLVLTASPFTESSVMLAWSGADSGVRGYKVERSVGDQSEWLDVARLGPNATEYRDEGVTPGTTYFYRLRTSNNPDPRHLSNVVAVTTTAPARQLIPPANLTVAAVATDEIVLSWQDQSDFEDGFVVEMSRGTSEEFVVLATVGPDVTTQYAQGLRPDSTYSFRVRAYTDEFNSGYSNVATATTAQAVPVTDAGGTAIVEPQPAEDTASTPQSANDPWTPIAGAGIVLGLLVIAGIFLALRSRS